jgi:hypothetical protein
MGNTSRRAWARPALRLACVVLAAVSLGGCVIVPARPWHPRYFY